MRVFLVGLAFVFGGVAYAADLDVQLLKGKYDGKWELRGISDGSELEITDASAPAEIKGKVIYYGSGGTARRWWNFTGGKLDGQTLTFTTTAGVTFSLEVDPKTLSLNGATSGAVQNANFQFRKLK